MTKPTRRDKRQWKSVKNQNYQQRNYLFFYNELYFGDLFYHLYLPQKKTAQNQLSKVYQLAFMKKKYTTKQQMPHGNRA